MKNKTILLIAIVCFLLSCKQSYQRNFFDKMPDLYIDTSLSQCQLDSFGIQKKGVVINKKIYYKINNSKNSFIKFDGFVRFTDSCLYYLHEKKQENEQPLFWFDRSKKKWAVKYNEDKLVELDSVELVSVLFDKPLNDTILTYHLKSKIVSRTTLQEIDLYNESIIGISKEKGFTNITCIKGLDTVKLLLYPVIKVTKSVQPGKKLFL